MKLSLSQEMAILDQQIKERIARENAAITIKLEQNPALRSLKAEMERLKAAIARYESSIHADKRKIQSCRYSDTSILANAITQNTIKLRTAKQQLEALELDWIKELNLY